MQDFNGWSSYSPTKSVQGRVLPDWTTSNLAGAGPKGLRNSNPARSGAGFGENLSFDHRTIHPMQLTASTMMSADIRRQSSSLASASFVTSLFASF